MFNSKMKTVLPICLGITNRLKSHKLPGAPLSAYEQQAIRPMNHVIVIPLVLSSHFSSQLIRK